MRRISDIVKEMVAGIFAVDVLIAVIGLLFVPQKVNFLIGLGSGFVIAVIMVFSMHESLGKAMDFEGKAATRQIMQGYAFRTGIMLFGMIAVCLIDLWALAAYFFGVMSLKLAAYLQPHIKKFLHHE